jgi:hypothetical protein
MASSASHNTSMLAAAQLNKIPIERQQEVKGGRQAGRQAGREGGSERGGARERLVLRERERETLRPSMSLPLQSSVSLPLFPSFSLPLYLSASVSRRRHGPCWHYRGEA